MQMIQPLTREEVQHRTDMAENLQNSTLIELRKAAAQYVAHEDMDLASAAQVTCELGRRGEWQHALAYGLPTPGIEAAKLFADEPFERLQRMEDSWPKSGSASDKVSAAVWALRAEMSLRRVEAATSSLIASVIL
jgi:hypothetical protein